VTLVLKEAMNNFKRKFSSSIYKQTNACSEKVLDLWDFPSLSFCLKVYRILILIWYFTGLTTWTCIAPRNVLASCIPVCLITLAFYPFLSNKSLIKKKVDIAKYQTIPQRPEDTKTTTTTRHIHFVIKVFPFASYYFLISFSLAISLASILTTLTFPSSPFLPRDHYQYYRLVSDVGIALGGLEVVLPSCLFPQHVKILRIRSLWVVVLLHTMLTVFFLCASWFHFLDNAYTLLVLVFVQGVTHGLVVVHAMAMMPRLFHDAREKGAAMGYELSQVENSQQDCLVCLWKKRWNTIVLMLFYWDVIVWLVYQQLLDGKQTFIAEN